MTPGPTVPGYRPMTPPVHRVTLFALYQLSIVAGILLLPVAVVLRHSGITLPVGRLVNSLGRAYEDARRRRA